MRFRLSEWLKRRKLDGDLERARHTATRHTVVVNPHHSVAIKPGNPCCDAAQKLRGKRFLSRDAPPLPLRDCGAEKCACTYQHFDDRRSGIDRRRVGSHPANERRGSRGRREDDL